MPYPHRIHRSETARASLAAPQKNSVTGPELSNPRPIQLMNHNAVRKNGRQEASMNAFRLKILSLLLLLAASGGCDCEKMLAKERGSGPVYRVEGSSDPDSGGPAFPARNVAAAKAQESRRGQNEGAFQGNIGSVVSRIRSSRDDANGSSGRSPKDEMGHGSPDPKSQTAVLPGSARRPPVWTTSRDSGPAQEPEREPNHQDESPRPVQTQWGTRSTSLSRLNRALENRLPKIGSRMEITGIRADLPTENGDDGASFDEGPRNSPSP